MLLFQIFKKLEGKIMARLEYFNDEENFEYCAFFIIKDVFLDKDIPKIRLGRYNNETEDFDIKVRAMILKNLADDWVLFDDKDEWKKSMVMRKLKSK